MAESVVCTAMPGKAAISNATSAQSGIVTTQNALFYDERACKLEQTGKYQEAVNILEKVIRAAPNSIVAYLNIAGACWGLNEYYTVFADI